MRINQIEVTLDDLQNGYYIYQAKNEFRFGIDAVFLSDFADVKPKERALDMGTGSAVIPILLAAKTKGEHFFGLEIQKNSVCIAQESVKYNTLQDRISIIEGDICRASSIFGNETLDVVVSNPPYMIEKHGFKNDTEAKYIARHEILCTFDDLARETSKVLRARGRFYFIHKPLRLAELIRTLCKYQLEPKRVKFIHPYADKEPVMVLVEAHKGAASGIRIEPPMILYKNEC